jgi:Tfp pilus assembly protein PilE
MKKTWLRLLKAFVILGVLAAIAIAAYLQHPLFGQVPTADTRPVNFNTLMSGAYNTQ